ncbi:Phosphoacetylglucosamine mutase, partial [Stegodyphus mimosarum]
MKPDFCQALNIGLKKYPRLSPKVLRYGTAGFREKAIELPHVMYRMGLLAVLKSKEEQGKTVGLMVTASHNPEEDNGIKLCGPSGEMINQEWEQFATLLVNSENAELDKSLQLIVEKTKLNYNISANVFLAKDTRSSGTKLLEAALDGVRVISGQAKDFGLLTTPQLHFVVVCQNNSLYGKPTVEGYYEKLSNAYNILLSSGKEKQSKRYDPELFVDGANGIGALKFKELLNYLNLLKVHVFNDGSKGVLNFKCGADYVKIEQKPPEGCSIIAGKRYASFDGDADRLVYFYKDIKGIFHLLDGDKIATLMGKYLKELVEQTGLNLAIRIIQTAYANGSSTQYIEKTLKIPVVFVPTGVKHLHHEAMKYDIGIYAEANGHGTVVFSDHAKSQLKNLSCSASASEMQKMVAQKLLNSIDLINETVGDAISNLLFVEAVLHDNDWTVEEWDSLYYDFPSRQLKVKVPDRQVIQTTDADRKCVAPKGLQEAIDDIISQYKNARSFVRPSGTEDIVRVHAEADTQEDADLVA